MDNVSGAKHWNIYNTDINKSKENKTEHKEFLITEDFLKKYKSFNKQLSIIYKNINELYEELQNKYLSDTIINLISVKESINKFDNSLKYYKKFQNTEAETNI